VWFRLDGRNGCDRVFVDPRCTVADLRDAVKEKMKPELDNVSALRMHVFLPEAKEALSVSANLHPDWGTEEALALIIFTPGRCTGRAVAGVLVADCACSGECPWCRCVMWSAHLVCCPMAACASCFACACWQCECGRERSCWVFGEVESMYLRNVDHCLS
jgi:hypothetical protein